MVAILMFQALVLAGKALVSIPSCKTYSKCCLITQRLMTSSGILDSQIGQQKKQVIVLSGATSSGKSAVTRELCKLIDAEVVIADSVQVYKYASIGSNKPTNEETSEVKHHLLDKFDPNDNVTSGDFNRLAVDSILDILRRGKTPVVVGGCTMWIEWLVRGVPDAPKPTAEVALKAEQFIAEYQKFGQWEQAIRATTQFVKNTERILKLSANDWYRLQRYIEVELSLEEYSNMPGNYDDMTSELNEDTGYCLTGQRANRLNEFDLRCFFLTEEREQLYRTIDERCVDMIERGLFEEVTELFINGHLNSSNMVSKSIGYRQTLNYLLSEKKGGDLKALENFIMEFSGATRNYAQKQMKWYRKDSEFLWLEIHRKDPNTNFSAQRIIPYRRVAEELLHWTRVSRAELQEVRDRQIECAKVVAVLRNKHRVKTRKTNEIKALRGSLKKLYKQNLISPQDANSDNEIESESNVEDSNLHTQSATDTSKLNKLSTDLINEDTRETHEETKRGDLVNAPAATLDDDYADHPAAKSTGTVISDISVAYEQVKKMSVYPEVVKALVWSNDISTWFLRDIGNECVERVNTFVPNYEWSALDPIIRGSEGQRPSKKLHTYIQYFNRVDLTRPHNTSAAKIIDRADACSRRILCDAPPGYIDDFVASKKNNTR